MEMHSFLIIFLLIVNSISCNRSETEYPKGRINEVVIPCKELDIKRNNENYYRATFIYGDKGLDSFLSINQKLKYIDLEPFKKGTSIFVSFDVDTNGNVENVVINNETLKNFKSQSLEAVRLAELTDGKWIPAYEVNYDTCRKYFNSNVTIEVKFTNLLSTPSQSK